MQRHEGMQWSRSVSGKDSGSHIIGASGCCSGGATINMATAIATMINGGNHLGRWSDCTVQRPGSLISTGCRCQTPSVWTCPSAQDMTTHRQPQSSVQCPWHIPGQWGCHTSVLSLHEHGRWVSDGAICARIKSL